MTNSGTPPTSSSAYAAFRIPGYRAFFIGHVLSVFGFQMQTTIVGRDIYLRTLEPLDLGLAGLIQFIPVLCLILVTGHVADRFNRKHVVMIATSTIALASLGLAGVAYFQWDYRWIFGCLLATGVARAFLQPAKASLVATIVPDAEFANAVTWNTTGFHLASVIGPAIAGGILLLRDDPWIIYLLDTGCALGFVGLLLLVPMQPPTEHALNNKAGLSLSDFLAGFRFLKSHQVILAAMSLDMFAVLFGGATALLPVFAEDILKTGPMGLAILKFAPAVGALTMGLALVYLPQFDNVGRVLLWSVVAFGVATIGFGLTDSMWVATLMLFLTGAFDNISVVIRHSLVQRLTPNELRGRVSAVNSLFIGASNELGAFESGLVAQMVSPVFSVVSGGFATLVVVAATAVLAPQLRRFRRI